MTLHKETLPVWVNPFHIAGVWREADSADNVEKTYVCFAGGDIGIFVDEPLEFVVQVVKTAITPMMIVRGSDGK